MLGEDIGFLYVILDTAEVKNTINFKGYIFISERFISYFVQEGTIVRKLF